MMKMTSYCGLLALGLASLTAACGGSNQGAKNASSETDDMPEMSLNEPPAEEPDAGLEEPAEESSSASSEQDSTGGSTFKPGMSVEEAMNAAPFAVNAVQVDIEKLEAPLMGSGLYAPCSIPSSQHYKVKVAVYQGKAVGIDVATTPANETVAGCVKEQIAAAQWEVNEESLNMVELSF